MTSVFYWAALRGLLLSGHSQAQARLATGSQKPMPTAEWIDQDTGHKIAQQQKARPKQLRPGFLNMRLVTLR